MKTYAIIWLGASGKESCDDTDEAIETALNERDRLTEEFGHDQAFLLSRGLTSDEVWDALQ